MCRWNPFKGTYTFKLSDGPDSIRAILEELLLSDDWLWLNIEVSTQYCLQIAKEGQDVLVNFSFPFRDSLESLFREKGIDPPPGSRLEYWPRSRWRGFIWGATFRVPLEDVAGIARFTHQLLTRLFECQEDRLDALVVR
ncbi:MAG TPA: hypothetical protein PKG54_05495 [Phycisphaerae bacterium]|jgi:hypothetical protein|nr:hypothetical protein [Phycisphaerae bacterium]HOB73963.1 hypothetical protein [Phycisphaerae bacterium]HOJ55351.1 hypothetical protein [Phycisphaerae bacterium]HOL25104.1 hypothetical protein [Phycisphaerae bacterium]HPP19720.1 hypothetical protein [Phycisphaerae bacterium]